MRQLTLEDIQSTDVDEAPLTAIPGVGPVIEESLREGGFETRSDVLEASMDELVQLRRIGESTAKALLEGGEGQYNGRPSGYMKHREECIELARQGLTYEAIAEGVGIGRSTLDDWRQRYDEFRDELRRAQKEVEIECAECSATMHLPPGREINTKYCSECKAPSVKVECDQCGIEFQCSDYRMRRNEHNYCSPGCHKEWISENRVGENHPDYKGDCDRIPSGPRWKSQRSKALRRDGHECQSCGLSREEHYTEYGIDLHVHHIRPRRTFDDLEKANRVKNLVTLCVPCHGVYEGAFLSPVHRPAGD